MEEALELDGRCFGGLGGVDDVGHLVVAEVAADGAFGSGFSSVNLPRGAANELDDSTHENRLIVPHG